MATQRLLFLPARLMLTSSISAFRKTKVVPFRSTEHLGYGNFTHSRMRLLKFEVGNRWTVLARSQVIEREGFLA
jgi:hypothetical protein